MRLSPPGTDFTAESTEAMRIKSLAQGENILMLRFEPATFVSKIDILTTTPIVPYSKKAIKNHHGEVILDINIHTLSALYQSAKL